MLPDRLRFGVAYGSWDAAGVKKGFDWVDAPEEETGRVLAVELPRTRVLTDNDGGARLPLLSFSMTMAMGCVTIRDRSKKGTRYQDGFEFSASELHKSD